MAPDMDKNRLRDGFRLAEQAIRPSEGSVSQGARSCRLEPRVMQVLLHLAAHPRVVLSKEEIFAAVWSSSFVEDATLARAISDIRRVLGDDARDPRFIQTIPKKGYRLMIAPEPLAESGLETPAASCRARSWWAALAVLAMFLFAGLGWYGASRGKTEPREASVAVLPFESFDDDSENAYFALGMTEDIITQLSKISSLKVISRTSVMEYAEHRGQLRDIGRRLGVATVLEGSVRRENGKVRIVSQLIDVETDEHLWAETYDRQIEGIFAVQGEVARQIARALSSKLSTEEEEALRQTPTAEPGAYDYYLKGREAYLRYRRDENEDAIAFYLEALAIDPEFALAHAGLADAYSLRFGGYGFEPLWVEKAQAATRRALELEPDLAEGHRALIQVNINLGRLQQALAAGRRALELRPNDAETHWRLADVHLQRGELERAVFWQHRYFQLDPGYTDALAKLGILLAQLELSSAAEHFLTRALAAKPNHSQVLVWQARELAMRGDLAAARHRVSDLMTAYPTSMAGLLIGGEIELLAGHFEAARQSFARAVDFSSLSYSRRFLRVRLAQSLLALGRVEEAAEHFTIAEETESRRLAEKHEDWPHVLTLALMHASRGKHEAALAAFEQAVDAGYPDYHWARIEPCFVLLRADERFQGLLARMRSRVEHMRQEVERSAWYQELRWWRRDVGSTGLFR